MTKKDYQALARAIYSTGHGLTEDQRVQWIDMRDAIAEVLHADNPRFHRETFIKACETGDVGKRPPRGTMDPGRDERRSQAGA